MARESKEFGYCVIHDDEIGTEGLEPDYKFSTIWDADDAELMAEEAAEDYHSNHDGWESHWPLKLAIFDGDKLIGKFEVELEHQPHFSAGLIA